MPRKKYPSRLTFLRKGTRHSHSIFRCTCGTEKEIYTAHVKNKLVASCGCLRKETMQLTRKHGYAKSASKRRKEYKIWAKMIQRCTDINCKGYEKYGAVGVTVCSSWLEFENFISDMGDIPSDKESIDRLDNSKGY